MRLSTSDRCPTRTSTLCTATGRYCGPGSDRLGMARAVKGMPSAPRSPKSLAKREIDRLLREAEEAGNKRNLAILLLLRHTGLRVGELCNLRLSDIRISERKRSVLVRSGKRDKDRIVPLNHDVREALEAYIKVRPAASDDHLFIG